MKTTWLKKYNELRTSDDLRREKLTLSDYHTIGSVIAVGRAMVVSLGVASWFKRNGASVYEHNGQFVINL